MGCWVSGEKPGGLCFAGAWLLQSTDWGLGCWGHGDQNYIHTLSGYVNIYIERYFYVCVYIYMHFHRTLGKHMYIYIHTYIL